MFPRNGFVLSALFVSFFNIFHFVRMGEIQNQTDVTITGTREITSTISSTVECGNTQKIVDECFKDIPPHLMEFLKTTKIAVNAEEITSKCTVFDRGMKCFDEYTARCLTHSKLNIIKNNIEGAKSFFIKFCGDPEFQKDYLLHRECFSHIQEDWMRCTKNFRDILSDELHEERMNTTNKFMEFCCARYAFENCIYNSARYKCYKHSVKFARDTAKMLSDEKHFSNCRQYENALCESSSRQIKWHWKLLYFCLLLVLQTLPKRLR